jgi:hypothetical protein
METVIHSSDGERLREAPDLPDDDIGKYFEFLF